MDLRQSPEYAQYSKTIGWEVKKIDGCHLLIKKLFGLPFRFIKCQRPDSLPLVSIKKSLVEYAPGIIWIEPTNKEQETILTAEGFKKNKSPFLPTKTVHLDLRQSEEKIFSKMEKDARYGIRKAGKKDIKILRPPNRRLRYKDIKTKDFHRAWKQSVNLGRYMPSLKNLEILQSSFGNKAIFLTALCYDDTFHRNKMKLHGLTRIIAGTVILIADKTAYYYYAFTNKEGRKASAQYLLVWEALKLAKKMGCRVFDFEGVYDERFPLSSWKGFTHFKKSFGGQEIEYPGCFSRFLWPKIF